MDHRLHVGWDIHHYPTQCKDLFDCSARTCWRLTGDQADKLRKSDSSFQTRRSYWPVKVTLSLEHTISLAVFWTLQFHSQAEFRHIWQSAEIAHHPSPHSAAGQNHLHPVPNLHLWDGTRGKDFGQPSAFITCLKSARGKKETWSADKDVIDMLQALIL